MTVMSQFASKKRYVLGISLASGVFLAIISEVGKLNIPGRHCDIGEMCLNIAGVVISRVCFELFSRWNRARKSFNS